MHLVLDDPKHWPLRPEIIDQIHELILENCRISAKSTDEQLGISRERVGPIINENLDMRKLSKKWVPKCIQRRPENIAQLRAHIVKLYRALSEDLFRKVVTNARVHLQEVVRQNGGHIEHVLH